MFRSTVPEVQIACILSSLPFYLTTLVGPLHEFEEVDVELFLEFTLIDEVHDKDIRLETTKGPDSQDEDDLPAHSSAILDSGKVTGFQSKAQSLFPLQSACERVRR